MSEATKMSGPVDQQELNQSNILVLVNSRKKEKLKFVVTECIFVPGY